MNKSITHEQEEILETILRVLWALVERSGGSITVSEKEACPMSGAFHVAWESGAITVSTAKDHPDQKQ